MLPSFSDRSDHPILGSEEHSDYPTHNIRPSRRHWNDLSGYPHSKAPSPISLLIAEPKSFAGRWQGNVPPSRVRPSESPDSGSSPLPMTPPDDSLLEVDIHAQDTHVHNEMISTLELQPHPEFDGRNNNDQVYVDLGTYNNYRHSYRTVI